MARPHAPASNATLRVPYPFATLAEETPHTSIFSATHYKYYPQAGAWSPVASRQESHGVS